MVIEDEGRVRCPVCGQPAWLLSQVEEETARSIPGKASSSKTVKRTAWAGGVQMQRLRARKLQRHRGCSRTAEFLLFIELELEDRNWEPDEDYFIELAREREDREEPDQDYFRDR